MYLESDIAIKNGNFIEAKTLLENILSEEPNYSLAHNSLGWLYRTQFDDYQSAEQHYKVAIHFSPLYPHPYLNYAYLLTDLERFGELEELMQKCLAVPSIGKAFVYHQRGVVCELQEKYTEAIGQYKTAARLSLNDEKIEEYKKHIARCETKMAEANG